jgi:two-component system cell cycle response regulator
VNRNANNGASILKAFDNAAYTIMVVDDDWLNLELMEGVLTLNGFRVLMASEGEQALRLATTHLPDLIILDVRMPGMNGYQVCEKLKAAQITRNIIVIMMTGLEGDDKEKQRGFDAGADDFISRSVGAETLVKRIANLLNARRLSDD